MAGKLDFITQEMTALKEQGLLINVPVIDSPQGAWITVNGKKVLNLCSNNYLGLANHEVLKRRAQKAIEAFGVGPAVGTVRRRRPCSNRRRLLRNQGCPQISREQARIGAFAPRVGACGFPR